MKENTNVQHQFAVTAPRKRRGRRWLMVVFWTLFVLATLGFLSDVALTGSLADVPDVVLVLASPLMLLPLWLGVLRLREPIHAAVRRVPLPNGLKFALLGLIFGIVLAANFSITFDLSGEDLHPNPAINTVLYFGIYGGVMLGWYLLKYIYAFSYRHVFWIGGIVFSMFEQNYVLPLTILSLNPLMAVLLAAYLIVCYGVPFAIPFLMMPEEQLPQGRRKLGPLGYLLCVAVPLLLFVLVGNLWFAIMDGLLGTGEPNI